MSYAVKEMFLTLQGEGQEAGRRAIFCRFAGCNLWSGREEDRAGAACSFCDTDFVGTDGENGGRYSAEALAETAATLWGEADERRYIVLTGGEPMLQVNAPLIAALHDKGFRVAMETNGTLAADPAIDWLTVSPKAGNPVVQRRGDELKLVWPQDIDWRAMEDWTFDHFLIQPMDRGSEAANAEAMRTAIAFVMDHPRWRLSLQNHKTIGLP